MDLFYQGQKDGVSEEEIRKYENENGFSVPPILREFLKKYSNLNVNKGRIRLCPPEYIREYHIPSDNGEVDILFIGKVDEMGLGIILGTDNLQIAVGKRNDKQFIWTLCKDSTLAGIMRLMIGSLLFKSNDMFVYCDDKIDAVLNQYGISRLDITPSEGISQHFSLNYDEESGVFIVAQYDDKGEKMEKINVVLSKKL